MIEGMVKGSVKRGLQIPPIIAQHTDNARKLCGQKFGGRVGRTVTPGAPIVYVYTGAEDTPGCWGWVPLTPKACQQQY